MKVLLFTEGTCLMHPSAVGVSRDERVKQSRLGGTGINNYKQYTPNNQAVDKIKSWKNQGAEIYYLSSVDNKSINDIKFVLKKYHFPDSDNLLHRGHNQSYAEIAQALMPDIIIEDDCESIGGAEEMTCPHLHPKYKQTIKSIVVPEFEGIDHLPDGIYQLFNYSSL